MKKLSAWACFAIFCSTTGLTASLHTIQDESPLPDDPRDLYITLLKNVLANTIYEDASYAGSYSHEAREMGYDHPKMAHTMIGMKRLNNIQYCLEQVIHHRIPGDCIETGVWRGGATIFMRGILKAHQDKSRKVWAADSFEGLPPPNPLLYPADLGLDLSRIPYLAVSLEQVQSNFKKYGLLDNQVIFLKGFFRDTIATAPIERLALLRLDGDLYESTMDVLINLYPKLSPGGYIIIDDYGAIGACSKAVNDYRDRNHITDPLLWIDYTGVYWQKTR